MAKVIVATQRRRRARALGFVSGLAILLLVVVGLRLSGSTGREPTAPLQGLPTVESRPVPIGFEPASNGSEGSEVAPPVAGPGSIPGAALDGACRVSVRVIGDESEAPVPGAQVQLAPRGVFDAGLIALTDEAGLAIFELAGVRSVRILATRSPTHPEQWRELLLTLSPTAGVVECTLRISESVGELAGVVRDPSGSPIIGATVTLVRHLPPAPDSAAGRQSRYVRVQTNDIGRYSLASIPANGGYVISAAAAGFSSETRRGIEVRGNAVTTSDFELQPERRVRGRVRLPTGVDPASAHVVGVIVFDRSWRTDQPVADANHYEETQDFQVDREGRFAIPVPASAAGIAVVARADGLRPVTECALISDLGDNEIEFYLATPGLPLDGSVSTPDGEPTAAMIEVQDQASGVLHARIEVDESGRFSCASLASGPYIVRARSRGRSPTLRATLWDVVPPETALEIRLAP